MTTPITPAEQSAWQAGVDAGRQMAKMADPQAAFEAHILTIYPDADLSKGTDGQYLSQALALEYRGWAACAAYGAQADVRGNALTRERIEEIAREVYKTERFTKDDEVWHNLYWLTAFAKAIEAAVKENSNG